MNLLLLNKNKIPQMIPQHTLVQSIESARKALVHTGKKIHTQKWQGMEIANKPEMRMFEALDVSIKAPMVPQRSTLANMVKPNLPWADVHFQERISGIPSNPGESYKIWPFYPKDDSNIKPDKFTHTYQERFWPKKAWEPEDRPTNGINRGIRFEYGDLKDVIALLMREPDTRQAYLPIWFPEDTGSVHGGRVPCSLGYHFIIRDAFLHCTYYLRSCDFVRHFRDDMYLAGLLMQHMVSSISPAYNDLTRQPRALEVGYLTMHIANLHCFESDLKNIR